MYLCNHQKLAHYIPRSSVGKCIKYAILPIMHYLKCVSWECGLKSGTHRYLLSYLHLHISFTSTFLHTKTSLHCIIKSKKIDLLFLFFCELGLPYLQWLIISRKLNFLHPRCITRVLIYGGQRQKQFLLWKLFIQTLNTMALEPYFGSRKTINSLVTVIVEKPSVDSCGPWSLIPWENWKSARGNP